MQARTETPDRIAGRVQRWREFMAPEAGPGFMFHVNYDDPEIQAEPMPNLWRENKQARIEAAWSGYQALLKKSDIVNDDRLPYLTNLTGTEIFAEALGCKVHRAEDNNPFAIPFVHTAAEADAVQVPELSSSSLAYLFDIADELHRRGGPDALMKPVDIQSPIDIVALIWDKSDLFIAMVETPDAVKSLAAKVAALLTAFLDEWFARYGTEFIAHYPDYFMSGGVTLSEDEVGVVSSEMFMEFFYDELVALSQRYGGIGMHCCADARHQWENLRKIPGLRLLNLCQPPTRPLTEYVCEAYDYFDGSIVQMHLGWTPDGPPESWPGKLPAGRRVVLDLTAESRDDAIRLADKMNAVREER